MAAIRVSVNSFRRDWIGGASTSTSPIWRVLNLLKECKGHKGPDEKTRNLMPLHSAGLRYRSLLQILEDTGVSLLKKCSTDKAASAEVRLAYDLHLVLCWLTLSIASCFVFQQSLSTLYAKLSPPRSRKRQIPGSSLKSSLVVGELYGRLEEVGWLRCKGFEGFHHVSNFNQYPITTFDPRIIATDWRGQMSVEYWKASNWKSVKEGKKCRAERVRRFGFWWCFSLLYDYASTFLHDRIINCLLLLQ